MTQDEQKVSIIIVNFNGKSYLKSCLESIENNSYKNFEIILVDNNSTDDSIDYVRKNFRNVKIIKLNKNFGFAEPSNIGAKNARGKLLYFLNNDTTLCQNSLEELVKVIQNPEIATCQSLLLKPDGAVDSSGDFITTAGITFSSKKKETNIISILSARGASMMIKKQVFWKLGGFDKKFFASFEDVDLGWRTWLLGYKVVLAPQSIVFHQGGKTTALLNNYIKFHSTKNTLVLCFVNFEFWNSLKSLFLLFRAIILKQDFKQFSIQDSKITFNTPSFKITMKAIGWIIKNLGYILKKRKKVNSDRKISTKKLIRLGLIKKI